MKTRIRIEFDVESEKPLSREYLRAIKHSLRDHLNDALYDEDILDNIIGIYVDKTDKGFKVEKV